MVKWDISYISFCPLRILYNGKFILMATFWGTNAVAVTRVHCTNSLAMSFSEFQIVKTLFLQWSIYILAGAQHFLQDCMHARGRLIKSTCTSEQFELSSQLFLCVAKDPKHLQADSKDWSDCVDAQADLSFHRIHMLSCRKYYNPAHLSTNSILLHPNVCRRYLLKMPQ